VQQYQLRQTHAREHVNRDVNLSTIRMCSRQEVSSDNMVGPANVMVSGVIYVNVFSEHQILKEGALEMPERQYSRSTLQRTRYPFALVPLMTTI
jgi:hypothetical protein